MNVLAEALVQKLNSQCAWMSLDTAKLSKSSFEDRNNDMDMALTDLMK